MLDRLIENWLTNVHELGYTTPFCQVLASEGETILHISRGGQGELGKDIITRGPDGKLRTYQLKQRDIALTEWNKYRGEIEHLVQLPPTAPGLSKPESHTPFLVTNGEIRGDAIPSIEQFSETWVKAGYPKLEIIQKGQLLKRFKDAHGSYLPDKLSDFREFIGFYIADFRDRFPREKFALFLERFLNENQPNKPNKNETKRSIESTVLLGSYVVEQYEKVGNHIAALEGWTIIAATIFRLVEANSLTTKVYGASISILWSALLRNFELLSVELQSRSHWIEPSYVFAEREVVRGARTLLVLGWLSARFLIQRTLPDLDTAKSSIDLDGQMPHLRLLGECEWPAFLLLALYTERVRGSSSCESMVSTWIRRVLQEDNPDFKNAGFPSTYWPQEKILELNFGLIPPQDTETFKPHTFTVKAAMNALVRRLCRQEVSILWPMVSELTFCNYRPDTGDEWLRWRSEHGTMEFRHPELTQSWTVWRDQTNQISRNAVPSVFQKHPEWLLPFCLTFPHRMNEQMTDYVDIVFGRRGELV